MKLPHNHESDPRKNISKYLNDKIIAAINADKFEDFPLVEDINCQLLSDNTFYTPLTYAAMKGSSTMIRLIVQ